MPSTCGIFRSSRTRSNGQPLEPVERRLAVLGHGDLGAERGQRRAEHQPDIRLVVDDQDSLATVHADLPRGVPAQAGAAGRVKVNVGALAGYALGVDLAAVGRDDLAGDRQAEPGAALGLGAGHAVELLEDPRQVLGRDALARVGHAEPDEPVAVGLGRDD